MVDLPWSSLSKLPIDDGQEVRLIVGEDVLHAEIHMVEGVLCVWCLE